MEYKQRCKQAIGIIDKAIEIVNKQLEEQKCWIGNLFRYEESRMVIKLDKSKGEKMNPNKYFEFEYNGESYVVPREWLEEHDAKVRAAVIEKILSWMDNNCWVEKELLEYLEQLKEQNK